MYVVYRLNVTEGEGLHVRVFSTLVCPGAKMKEKV